MAGTKAGGMKAAATNKAKYGDGFYQGIGRRGGQNGHTGGFAADRELAVRAGRKGGRVSKRGVKSITELKIEPMADEIIAKYNKGWSVLKISKAYDLPYEPLCAWVRGNITVREWKEN